MDGPPSTPVVTDRATRVARRAWVLLDWGASAFSTISITFLVAYVDKIVFAGAPWGVPGGVVWAWTLAAAMLVTALVAPWCAAWADRRHAHKRALSASVLLGCAGAFLLALLPPTARGGVVAAVVVVAVGFDLAAIFTGSLLPRIAKGTEADRLSAIGYAAGYAGGAIALGLATLLHAFRGRLGLDDSGALRASFVLMGAWWLVFSLPALRARFGAPGEAVHSPTSAGELVGFARQLRRRDSGHGSLGAVLSGAVLVLGAMQTAIAQFSSVALEEFGLEPRQLVLLVLLVQMVALPGALAVGWLSTRSGRGPALTLALSGWVLVFVLGWFVTTTGQLWGLAVLLALVLGGAASVIRAAVAGLAPEGRFGATFGLLNVGSKLAGFVASTLFGAVYAVTGNSRAGLLALVVQLVAGWWLLARAGDGALDSGTGRSGGAADDGA